MKRSRKAWPILILFSICGCELANYEDFESFMSPDTALTNDSKQPTTSNHCTAHELSCDGDNLMVCKSNAWVLKETCKNECKNNLCITDTGGTPSNTCENDTYKCSGNYLLICNQNTWLGLDECNNGCKNGKCLTEQTKCKIGDTKCESSDAYICQSGEWLKKKCDIGCKNGKCMSCTNDETKCVDSFVYSCKDGEWEQNKCKFGCKDGKCLNCTNDNTKCTGNDVYICQGDDWQKKKTCEFGCLNGKCMNCKNDDTKCESDDAYLCQSGEWIRKDCEFGCLDGACLKCRNDDTKCEGTYTFICQGDNWIRQEKCEYGCENGECLPAPLILNLDDTTYRLYCDYSNGYHGFWADIKECAEEKQSYIRKYRECVQPYESLIECSKNNHNCYPHSEWPPIFNKAKEACINFSESAFSSESECIANFVQHQKNYYEEIMMCKVFACEDLLNAYHDCMIEHYQIPGEI